MADEIEQNEGDRQRERIAMAVMDTAARYRVLFSSEEGQRVLNDLRFCYGGSTSGRDHRETERRSAQRDVLMRIEDLMRIASGNPSQAVAELKMSPAICVALTNPWREHER